MMTMNNVMEIEEVSNCEALPLLSLNHVSVLCRSVWESVRFYEEVLGFVLIKRPSSFKFNGAWLYSYGIGIHLIENPALVDDYDASIIEPRPINPKDNHISFQCTDVGLVKRRLQEMGMRYVTAVVEEEGNKVDQVFFHDPDGYMIELCNCENIPIIPLSSSCPFKTPMPTTINNNTFTAFNKNNNKKNIIHNAPIVPIYSCGFMESVMMESLSMDMLNFSF